MKKWYFLPILLIPFVFLVAQMPFTEQETTPPVTVQQETVPVQQETVPAQQETVQQAQKYVSHETLNAILWMQTSGEFKGLCYQAYNTAKLMLDRALADKNWCADLVQQEENNYQDLPPAVILDIDETVLDNTIFQGSLILENKPYSGRSWNQWCKEARATALAGAAEFCNYAIQKGVAVYYVTNRWDSVKDVTEKNLVAQGFPLEEGKAEVYPKVKERTKGGRRAKVAQNHRIVLLVGDNNCDFSMLFNDTTVEERDKATEQYATYWGTKWILLPNPAYGDWENSVLEHKQRLSDQERLQLKYSKIRK